MEAITIQETLAGFKTVMTEQGVENFLISATKEGETIFSFHGNIIELLTDSLDYLHAEDPELAKNALIHLMNFVGEWYQLNATGELAKSLH